MSSEFRHQSNKKNKKLKETKVSGEYRSEFQTRTELHIYILDRY